jgi:hypothetical protein
MINSPSGTTFADNKIVFGNSNGVIWQAEVDTPYTQTALYTLAGGDYATAISSLDQTYTTPTGGSTQQWIAVGTSFGNLKVIDVNAGTVEDRTYTTTASKATIMDMCVYNKKLALMMGGNLWSVDLTSPGVVVWNLIQSFGNRASGTKSSMAVHNGTLYVLMQYRGGSCALWSSDGVTGATLVYKFDNAYAVKLHSLKGGLYIHVNEYTFTNAEPTDANLNLALYSYAGGVVKKLTSRENASQYFTTAQSNGPSCVWGNYIAIACYSLPRALSSTEDRTIGFLLYNPENDSFHMGPCLKGFAYNAVITSMNQSNGALYFDVTDGTNNFLVGTSRSTSTAKGNWNGSYPLINGVRTTEQKFKLVSSAFDGGFPDLQKTWLRVNVKHNLERGSTADTIPTMNIYVRTSSNDYSSTEYLIGTYTPPVGLSGWRTSSFDIAVSGVKFPKSNQLRYVVELKYPHDASNSTYGEVFVEKAMIESISVEYMLVASPKKVWRTRVLAEDAQPKLSGTANALTTRTSMSNKLFEYWTSGQPLYYWDASPSSITPTFSGGVPTNHTGIVMATDVGENSYRIDDNGQEVISEISLTLYEVA